MEAIKEILNDINTFMLALKMNPAYVLLWVAAGYIQKVYLKGFVKVTLNKKVIPVNEVWKTFLLGSLFSLVYAYLQRPILMKSTWVEFFASYLFATSMYELFLKDLVNGIITKIKAIYGKVIS